MQEMQLIIEQIKKFALDKKLNNKSFSDKYLLEFIEIFFSDSVGQDFVNYDTEDLFNLVLSSFEFFSSKPENDFKVRLHNPTKKKDGFESQYTILDVSNENMPFLVDSVVMQFDSKNIQVKNIIHPILTAHRSGEKIVSFAKEKDCSNESLIQLHLEKIPDNELKSIENRLFEVLKTVKMAVSDWSAMIKLAKKSGHELISREVKISKGKDAHNSDFDVKEAASFVDWMSSDSFIFLGAVEFEVNLKDGIHNYKEVPNSRLGAYKSEYKTTKLSIFNASSKEIDNVIKNPYLVEILKSSYKSQIHRNSEAERIRIQKFDDNGKVIGEYRFIGLFTSSVYYQNPKNIPIVRKKIEQVILSSGYGKSSSKLKDLLSTLESYPRDELLQICVDDLLRISTGIVAIAGRSLVRMFSRNDKFCRFVSYLIFIPRDKFNTELKESIQDLISKAYKGKIAGSFVQTTDSNLTRIHLVVRTTDGIPDVDLGVLEKKLIKLCRSWNDDLKDEILKKFSEGQARKILELYNGAFSAGYTNYFDAKAAVRDIGHIGSSIKDGEVVCDLYQRSFSKKDTVELKLYSSGKKLLLSNIMPVLDSFGFSVVLENTYLASPNGKQDIWIHYFNLNLCEKAEKLSNQVRDNFIETIGKIWSKDATIGHLNRLVFYAEIDWRQIYLLRGYSKYLYQIGLRYSQNYLSDVLVKNCRLTKLLIELFEAKFDPHFSKNRSQEIEEISGKIKHGLSLITDVAEDVVIRKFLNIIEATIRTNFYQRSADGKEKSYASFKFDSSKIIDLPLPIMYAEIFVYSVDVEGVHLRGGKVARGGLRWSDRHDDFRTEVLGLVKAQMTKNAVIVPVGSKGGFVVKKSTIGLSREEVLNNGIEAYKTFLKGLLDVTDNVIDGEIINPENVIRYDENDPYLVVAADKGTATFSDTANEISAEYNFWLGDAFASGGSVGYDHKKMGITAKGAWVAVVRHFSEMGIDIQEEDFTCAGIGDLSGDVFGNGMLLSKHIKLVAAFNHMHIFLDPDPESASSFEERKRIFELPRSSWTDYDQSKISKGGGIFARTLKKIPISPEVRKSLIIEEGEELTPDELIKLILQSPVDLIWNGGIGTYVKASDESHLDAGDRINDVLRVNGNQLQCKVVGEGGNLGLTQKGRIEASLNGVRINTDAMDNSAGVDCSDHEVNIKIVMTAAMKAGKVSLEGRNEILEQMTQEVSDLVLNDNEEQTRAVSISHSQGYLSIGYQAQFLNSLEKSGVLNRAVEFLPTNKEIAKRQADKIGLSRPELCVMLAYSKMDLYPQILASDLVKDSYLEPDLFKYFPKLLQEKFPYEIRNHQLRSEIIATVLTNSIVNKAGITFVNQIASDTGFMPIDIVRNYIIACDAFGLDEIWAEIDVLGSKIPNNIQSQMFFTINKFLERAVVWLLRNQQKIDISTSIIKYGSIITQLLEILEDILATASQHSFAKKVKRYSDSNTPKELARKIAAMDPLASAFDIAEIATHSDVNLKAIAKIYFEVGTRLNLKWLRSRIAQVDVENDWQKLSLKAILEDLYSFQMKFAKQAIEHRCFDKNSCPKKPSVGSWIESRSFMVQRYDGFICELKEQINLDLPMFVVALNRVKALI
ncbi:MAG: glutamate dehydrogenase [Rickettsiales bacterium]|jgi:glutamate dehydrogenase